MTRQDSLLDRVRLFILKLDKIFILVPFSVSKIEIRMRNIIANHRHILDGISHFMNFYLINR